MACIKTLLINAVKADIETIADIKKVTLNPYVKPLDGDHLTERPYAVLIDQPEKPSRTNRWRRCTFDLVITTLVYDDLSENLSPVMDDLQAKIYAVLTNENSSYRAYCQKWEEVSAEKTYVNENEGALVQIFTLTYHHDFDNPYTVNP